MRSTIAARKIIKALNPVARLIETDFCDVPLDEVLDTELFSLEAAEQNPLWFKELNGFKDHMPETEEYGIRSFVYRAASALQPATARPAPQDVLAGSGARQRLFLARYATQSCRRTEPGGGACPDDAPWHVVGGCAS